MERNSIGRSQRSLLRWYRKNHRNLPWRNKPTLYRTLVSEFMLQQTRVDQVLGYYKRFLKKFPDIKQLASAEFDEVLKLWEGLGYYRRAANLHETAKRLARMRGADVELLSDCPGVGSYTKAAIASIVWAKPLPVVDGNVKRVIARYFGIKKIIDLPPGIEEIESIARHWLVKQCPGDWNQAVMELGAMVCTPRNPSCSVCPIRTHCKALAFGNPEQFPLRKKKKPRPHRHTIAAVIRRSDCRVLIVRRPEKGLLPNLWEFPGGEKDKKRTFSSCIRQCIQKRVGLNVSVGGAMASIDHGYTHYSITLHAYDCRLLNGDKKISYPHAWKWVRAKELKRYPFPRAQWSIVEKLQDVRKSRCDTAASL